jgi:hypothetical protein
MVDTLPTEGRSVLFRNLGKEELDELQSADNEGRLILG